MPQRAVVVPVLLGVVLVLSACVGGERAAEGTIKVGALMPLSGQMSQAGQSMNNAFRLAVQKINDDGGVNGRQVELIFEDTAGDPAQGMTAARKLIEQDQVWGLAGTLTSEVALAVAPVAMEAGVPFVVTAASAAEITDMVQEDPEQNAYLFRTGAHPLHFEYNIEPFIREILEAENYYYVAEDAMWAHDVGQMFEGELAEQGIEKLGDTVVQPGTEDFAPVIADIQSFDPDVVIATLTSAEGVPFARQYYDAQVSTPFIATAGALTYEENVKSMGSKADYITFFAWTWDLPITGKTQPFYREYQERYGSMPIGYQDVRTYDGLSVMIEALRNAGSTDPDAWVEAMEDISYTGVAGVYEFDESHQAMWGEELLTGVLGQWRDGAAVIFWPEEIATGDFERAPWWK